MASSSKVKSENKKTQLDTVFSHLVCYLILLSFAVDYKATVCILILADVDVIARIKKPKKILLMNKFLTNCLMLLFYFLAFDWMILLTSLWTLKFGYAASCWKSKYWDWYTQWCIRWFDDSLVYHLLRCLLN